MQQTVVLQHDVPGDGFHFDWMIEQSDCVDEYRLMTWRLDVRPDVLLTEGFACDQLPTHRARYLTYEGELSGGRGGVRRVCHGEVIEMSDGGDSLRIVIQWPQWRAVYTGHRTGLETNRWAFRVEKLCEESESRVDG